MSTHLDKTFFGKALGKSALFLLGAALYAQGVHAYQMPSTATLQANCVTNTVVAEGAGYLCSLQPSKLNSNTLDAGTTANGYGYHAIYFPTTSSFKGVYLHLTGTYGRPYNQATANYENKSFYDENNARGYLIIQVAYPNEKLMNTFCDNASGNSGVNNCMGIVRDQMITANDPNASSVSGLSVNSYNSINYRLSKIIQQLITMGALPSSTNLIDSSGNVQWQNFSSIGGHSQGSGHAFYIAKNFANVQHVCLLSGIYDIPDTVNPNSSMADWQFGTPLTSPVSKIVGLIGDGDIIYQGWGYQYSAGTSTLAVGARNLQYAYGVMGLTPQLTILSNAGQTKSVSHGDVMTDPTFAAQRSAACMP